MFDSVSGLSQDSVVRYNGVDVGNVLSIDLDRQDPSLVRVRVEINAATPIRKDTVATLSSQGVTGVSFVALEGGSRSSAALVVVPPAEVPLITSQLSVVQELTDVVPNLLKEADALIKDVRQFTTPENKAALASILSNLEQATAKIDAIAARADTVLTAAEKTLARTDTALQSADTAFVNATAVIHDDVPGLIDGLKATVADVGATATELKKFARTGLPEYSAFAAEARSLVGSIGALTDRISRDPTRFLLGNQTPAYRN